MTESLSALLKRLPALPLLLLLLLLLALNVARPTTSLQKAQFHASVEPTAQADEQGECSNQPVEAP